MHHLLRHLHLLNLLMTLHQLLLKPAKLTLQPSALSVPFLLLSLVFLPVSLPLPFCHLLLTQQLGALSQTLLQPTLKRGRKNTACVSGFLSSTLINYATLKAFTKTASHQCYLLLFSCSDSPAGVRPLVLPAACLCLHPHHGTLPRGSQCPQEASVHRK